MLTKPLHLKPYTIFVFGLLWAAEQPENTGSDLLSPDEVDAASVLANSCFITHPADTALAFIWSPVSAHPRNVNPIFTPVPVLIFIKLCLFSGYMLDCVHQVVASFLCLQFGAGHVVLQWVYQSFWAENSCCCCKKGCRER